MTLQPAIADVPLPWQLEPWRALTNLISERRVPHALLVTGGVGLGKTVFATALARLLLCQSPSGESACGHCPSCTQFVAGTHPDFHPLTVEEEKSSISVEQLRALISDLQLKSGHGGRKVALIEPAEAMSSPAANSLLKTLEEPPADTVLLLVTSKPGRLPATVRSRCQNLPLIAPMREVALAWLGSRLTRDDWPVLLGFCGGAPLAALALAVSGIEERRRAFFAALVRLRAGHANPVLLASHPKEAYPELLKLLWSFVSDLILIRCAGPAAPVVNLDQLPLLQKNAESINLRCLYAYLDRIEAAIQTTEIYGNRELAFAALLTEWTDGLAEIENAPLAAQTAWGWT